MAKIYDMLRLWSKFPILERITQKLQQMKNQTSLNKQVFYLSILSISLLLLLYLFLLRSSSETVLSVDLYQQNLTRAEPSYANEEQPIIFSKYQYLNQTRTPSENVICFLVASFTGDVRLAFNPYPRLREKIMQLDKHLNDSNVTDLIIFHTGYPFRSDLIPIIEATKRQVEFVNIDHIFNKFPPGFDPHSRDPTWSQKGKWNYHHMCYFWFKQVFELKIIHRYRYMMRLDDDSGIGAQWPNIFEILAERQALYMANNREVDYEYVLPGIKRIRNVLSDFMHKKKITARNPEMLADIFKNDLEIPNFWNNLEVVEVAFMRRKEVRDFTEAVDDSRGIFLYRWGDAPLRYATLALFVNASQLVHRGALKLAYCHPC